MLTSVEFRTNQGAVLVLPIEDPEGFEIQEIEGLDPVKATITSSNFAQVDGVEVEGTSTAERQIIFKIGLNPEPGSSVSSLRSRLYEFLLPESEVDIRFITEEYPVLIIRGTVEDFNSSLFSRTPTASISIFCPKSPFEELEPTTFSGKTTTTPNSLALKYVGSSTVGIKFRMKVNRSLNGFSINRNFANGLGAKLTVNYPMHGGDIIEIDTNSGSKGAYLTRGGARRSILAHVSGDSSWIDIRKGTNTIRVAAEGTPIDYTIEYTAKYGGL